jgi:hypothetical protein
VAVPTGVLHAGWVRGSIVRCEAHWHAGQRRAIVVYAVADSCVCSLMLQARATGDAAESLAHAAADALVGLALKNSTTDNVTVIVGLVRWA